MEDGSIFYAVGEQAEKILDVYPDAKGEKHTLQKGIFSRKKQIVPSVMDALI
jgi:inorganic pyrophosphatase/exopolyphosphatase